MKEIIEKWANCYIRYGCKTENDAQETNEDLLNLLRMIEKQEEITAVGKKPTEYEHEKVEFELCSSALLEFESGVIFCHFTSDDYHLIGTEKQLALMWSNNNIFRRIELTSEQLHERKVEELASETLTEFKKTTFFKNHSHSHNELMKMTGASKFAVRFALEWMESKGE